jgi:hypothetical protein
LFHTELPTEFPNRIIILINGKASRLQNVCRLIRDYCKNTEREKKFLKKRGKNENVVSLKYLSYALFGIFLATVLTGNIKHSTDICM